MKTRTAIFTGGLVLALVALVATGVLVLTKTTEPAIPPATTVSALDRGAPRSLVQAAHDVGFYSTANVAVGHIEGRPASAASPPSPGLLRVGTTAPPFTLKTPTGQAVSLSDFRGKAVLLEFFATWCPHCNAEAPHLRALSRSLSGRKIAFVSVNGDGETAPSVFAYHLYYGFDFPALLDPSSHPGSFQSSGQPGAVTKAYAIRTFPTFYVIDPKGKIAWASDGEQPDALLRQELLRAA